MRFCKFTVLVAGSLVMLISGCNSGPNGTYTDANGAVILELRSGGKANFTFMGDVQDCTHETSGKQLTLICKATPAKPFSIFTMMARSRDHREASCLPCARSSEGADLQCC